MNTGTSGQYLRGDGTWVSPPPVLIPTDKELEEHPTLKQAWDEYMVIRKLLGL